jgi:sigma-E factor negative regulatory protein RseB
MLKRMSDADRNQSYQGTFILRKSDNLSTLRVTHGVGESGAWESIEMLNGEPKKVLRNNNRVVTVYPEQELITIRYTDKTRSLHLQLPKNIEQLELFYSLNRLSDDRIANRRTLVVELLPKDQYRYGYRYWVDKETGMLLRCDLVVEDDNKEKKVIEQMMFVSLDYLIDAPVPGFELEQYALYRQQVLDEPVVDVMQSKQQHWVVNSLPDGFMLTQSSMRYSQSLVIASNDSAANSSIDSTEVVISKTSPPDLLHMVYSDGLASVSIFIEKNQGLKKHLQGGASMGAVNAFGRSVGDYFVTVVGEVPVRTVESIAQSTAKLP